MYALMHRRGKHVTINSERRATGNPSTVRSIKDHRTERAHFRLQQAMRVRDLRTLERVRANEFAQTIRAVRGCSAHRAHLMQVDVKSTLGELPGSL